MSSEDKANKKVVAKLAGRLASEKYGTIAGGDAEEWQNAIEALFDENETRAIAHALLKKEDKNALLKEDKNTLKKTRAFGTFIKQFVP